MRPTFNEKLIAYLTLLSGLSISAVAVYYSVVGLTSIFAAAAIPIIIMGTTLEVSKLVATIWLKQNWSIAPRLIKVYLFSAIAILMLITSMGIFGFLSKAHLDQSVHTGDVADKIALIDEKIKTQRENVDAYRKALKQMDESVDQLMARSTDESGAGRSANLRKTQQKERGQLQADIAKAQEQIARLNEERAPVAKDLRKVEAEVGPIKYIAAFFYGNTDQTILEKAVTWVILTLIVVFDPLAVILLLASQISFQRFREFEDSQIRTITESKPNWFDHLQKKFKNEERPNFLEKDPPIEDSVLPEIPLENMPPMPPVKPPKEEEKENLKEEVLPKEPTKTFDFTKVPPSQEHVIIDGQRMSVKAAKDLYPQTPTYVQNEEQTESGKWTDMSTSTQISQDDYITASINKNVN